MNEPALITFILTQTKLTPHFLHQTQLNIAQLYHLN